MIKTFYSTPPLEKIKKMSILETNNHVFYAIHWHKMAKNLVAREIGQLLWTDGLVTYMIRKLRSCSSYLSYFFSYKIMVAKQKFEKCTVATLGVPCWIHGTPNTAWQNQPQSAIICNTSVLGLDWMT